MRTYRILILEDDLETLGVIMDVLRKLEAILLKDDKKGDVAVTVFSEYTQVEDYLNKIGDPIFDMVLLDRDCKLGGSFHALDLDKFGKDKIIGISSVFKPLKFRVVFPNNFIYPEPSTLVAFIVYVVLAWGIVSLVRIASGEQPEE
jgi:hypothetical protein